MVTDLHVDYDYTEGMSNKCDQILCCRTGSGTPEKPEDAAGKWGDYKCDIPERTVVSMLEHVRDET